MQKNQKKAYILIWSIFLSITIGITFISISSQISKDLKNNSNLKEKISINNIKNNKINDATENNNFENIELNKNEMLIFENDNFLNIGLKENEEININLNEDKNLTIKINTGSPVSYINENNTNINGIITNSSTFLSGSGNILIKNLGGYSNIDIIGETKFKTEYKKYKIIEKIGNKNIIKENGKIKLN